MTPGWVHLAHRGPALCVRQEVEELCAEWQPEPLEGSITDAQRLQLQQAPVLSR